MKTFSYKTIVLIVLMSFGWTISTFSQNSTPVVAVLEIDSKGFTITPAQMGDITRKEISKLGTFEVMDNYDVNYLLDKHNLTASNCFGKLCLVDLGQKIQCDKILTGSAEVYNETIIITMRLIDIGTGSIEKTTVMEYLNIRPQVQKMIELTLRSMFELGFDEGIMTKLTKQFDYESSINMPEVSRLNLNGPRMGLTLLTGDLADIYSRPSYEGGFDIYPLMFQMGYQFEIKYLNQGDFQALFEFIPTVTGLDQSKFIPSMSILNGMRSNRTGLEFAFGPIIYMSKIANGYVINDKWYFDGDSNIPENADLSHSEKRVDSRGSTEIETRFLFAIGKSFRSGNLNIPVNAFFIPDNNGHRFGISVGYNAGKK